MKNWLDKYSDNVPQAQKGKTIYVESENDPRYKAYQDSLSLYNNHKEIINSLSKEKYEEKSPIHTIKKKYSNWNFAKKQTFEKPKTTGLQKINESLYTVNDFIPSTVNKNLPTQLFSNSIDPLGTQIFYKGSVYGDNVFHPKKINGKSIDELEKDTKNWLTAYPDYRVVADYSNVKPQQQVIVKPTTTKQTTKPTNTGWIPLTPEIAKGRYNGDLKNMVYRKNDYGSYDITYQAPPEVSRQPVKAIQNLQPKGIQNVQNKPQASDIEPLPQGRVPKYLNVVDKVNQNFGGTETQYRWSPNQGELRQLSDKTYPDGTPYNTRTITPQYQNGGQFSGTTNKGFNYNGAWGGQFQMGGNVYPVNYVPKAQDGTELSEYDIAMRGMMKSKIGMGNAFNYPAIKRMSQAMPKTGMTPEGIGTHYMSSVDNYAVPELQDLGEEELTLIDPNPRSREAIRFNSPEEAQYFAENYKDVAPMSTTFKGLQEYAMGGSIPGSTGMMYARTNSSNNKNLNKLLPSAQDGKIIKDDNGYWNPDNWGSPVEINSNNITMEGVYEPLLGISDTGDTKLMQPGKNYKFKGKKVTEFPIAKNGGWLDSYQDGGKLPKAQDGSSVDFDYVDYGTPEYKEAYEQGKFAFATNPLDEVVITQYDEKYPFYQSLSPEEKKYINDPSPIGRQIRARATDGEGFNAKKAEEFAMGLMRDLPLSALQAPQSALVEGVEAVRGNEFNMLNALDPFKQRIPSETLGFDTKDLSWYNPKSISNFALDVVADPTNLVGVGLVDDAFKLGLKNIPQKAGKALGTESGLLSNAWKLNPKAYQYNLPENAMYRGLGQEGMEDALSSGLFRARAKRPSGVADASGVRLKGKGFGDVYFSPEFEVADRYGRGFIAETPKTSANWKMLDSERHASGWSQFSETPIPIDEGRILQKDWLQGYKEVPKQLPSSGNLVKAGFPNPLAIADRIIPRPPIPTQLLGVEDSWNYYSPLNLIPGYGKKLVDKTSGYPNFVGFRKFGNSIDDVIESQSLRPKGGNRMGAEQIAKEGNWAEPGKANENYPGVFEATMNPQIPGSNIKLEKLNKRNGIVGTTKEGDVAIPLTDPGLSFNRRLPFSNKYVPIDKQKLIEKEFQLATQLPHVQSLIEKYGLWAGVALASGYMVGGKEQALENLKTINKYSVDPVINWSKEQWKDFEKTINGSPEAIGTGAASQMGEEEPIPEMKQGGIVKKLNQLTNFTNYNKPTVGGWLDKY